MLLTLSEPVPLPLTVGLTLPVTDMVVLEDSDGLCVPDEHCVELTLLLPEALVVEDKEWDSVPLTHTVPVAEAQEELDTLLL